MAQPVAQGVLCIGGWRLAVGADSKPEQGSVCVRPEQDTLRCEKGVCVICTPHSPTHLSWHSQQSLMASVC